MASEKIIKQQISHTVKGKYEDWLIGVTDDPIARKAQLGNPLDWLLWEADSEDVATKVKKHFVRLCMKSSRSPAKSGKFVYILHL
ncbi:MAG: hypothetical protein ACE5IR_06030 [bacterium]